MRIRTAIFLGYLSLVLIGFYFFTRWIRDDVRKNYLETVEEGMVDTVRILAAILETAADQEQEEIHTLTQAFDRAHKMEFAAKIYEVTKDRVGTDVYITDENGMVLFDSGDPANVGKDFSRWNDVHFTLRGKYGARATRKIEEDPKSTTLYVAAPICQGDQIVGVVAVYKPVNFIHLFIDRAKEKIIRNAVLASILVLGLALLFSTWLTSPILALTEYARKVRKEGKADMPRLGRGEIGELGRAFEEMREALEGKHYVENYVQHLTHEMKSPLSAIQGAVEFLEDPALSQERKDRLLRNIRVETERLQQVVQRMLQLSSLENRKSLEKPVPVDMGKCVRELIENCRERYPGISFQVLDRDEVGKFMVKGDPLLLYQAVDNLVRNAVEFSPEHGTIGIDTDRDPSGKKIRIRVLDEGTGIPDFALDRVFERFYSLPRPESGKKSSGLGLSLVRQIADLHGGTVTLTNRDPKGVEACLSLPVTD